MRYQFYDSDARLMSGMVRKLLDDAITVMLSDPCISDNVTRTYLELRLADLYNDAEPKFVRVMRAVRARLEDIGEHVDG